MSYCRYSSDNYSCDVYAYESCYGGFDIHLASNRIVGEIPKVDFKLIEEGKVDEYIEQYKKQSEYFESCTHEPITLPYAGESFNEPTLEDFKNRMIELRQLGYRFPDYVFNIIDEEMKEL